MGTDPNDFFCSETGSFTFGELMKKAFLFILSFVAVLLLAVFLSPLLYQILPYKFERIFNRIVMVGTLICVALFVRIKKETFTEYGLIWQKDSLRFLMTAFLAPVVVLSLYVGVQILVGEAVFSLKDVSVWKWIQRILIAVLTGLLIGTIEEFFFRGVIFKNLGRFLKPFHTPGVWVNTPQGCGTVGLVCSLVVTNIFYSIVHFVHAKKPFVDSTPDFIDGFRLLAAPFSSFAHFGSFWPGFVGLFIFGLMLSGLTLKTKSLYPAIGLHAGAVFFIKTDGLWVDFSTTNMIWGSGKMYDGFVGWAALAILYFVLSFLLTRGSWLVARGAK